ncbi:MAG: sensor domain-containing diguanylate cyclase [Cyanothece sp. SIO1E1]|nr:sensor domain-containing diguanylate cyclase [Cyanothece sp. SIO1E1]
MASNWQHIISWIEAAIDQLESPEALLPQATWIIANTYQAECLLWSNPKASSSNPAQVYATPGVALQLRRNPSFRYQHRAAEVVRSSPPYLPKHNSQPSVEQFWAASIPAWLLEQIESPQIIQLETNDLVIPVTSAGLINPFWLQLQRFSSQMAPAESASATPTSTTPDPLLSTDYHFDARVQTVYQGTSTPLHNWSEADMASLARVCSQLTLAYQALYWRKCFNQSRQQAALVGRITNLLNSSLNPNQIINRIMAELGQSFQSECTLLIDLRKDPITVLASWERPESSLQPMPHHQIEPVVWDEVIEMFTQGGASYFALDLNQAQAGHLQGWLHEIGAISALMVPLFIQAEFFGGILLLFCQPAIGHAVDDLQTLRQVTDQVGIALANAQHYKSLWYQQETLRIQNNSLQLEMIQDELTHLLNRRSLEHELEELSASALWAVRSDFTVMICDIDYFKLVNDTYGHLVGDAVLRELAQRIQRHLRQGTSAYRYGGEEFVVIFPETALSKAVGVAERLRLAIRNHPINTTAGPIRITTSFGLAQQNSTQDRDAWEVLNRAQKALSTAKRQGRDRVVSG